MKAFSVFNPNPSIRMVWFYDKSFEDSGSLLPCTLFLETNDYILLLAI